MIHAMQDVNKEYTMQDSLGGKDKRRVLAEGKHLRLIQEGRWEYAERTKAKGAVVIVAVTDDRRLLLVEQYRVPVARRVVELPAGLVGDVEGEEAEELEAAARRELLEETGYEAATMKLVAIGPPTSGLASEIVAFIVASQLKQTSAGGGDDSEEIEVHTIELASLPNWLEEQSARDVLIDPKVYAGLYFAERIG
jgi:ADP-ribose pyrophosphatase